MAKKPTRGKKLNEELVQLAAALQTARYKTESEAVFVELMNVPRL